MLPRAAIIGVLILSASCNKTESGDVIGSAPSSGSGSPTKPGSGSGFSADLARELGSGGSAPAAGSAGPPKVVGGDPLKVGNVAPRAGSDAVAMAGNAAQPDPALKAGAEAAKRGGEAMATTESAAKPDPAAKPGGDAAAMTGRAAKPDPAAAPPNAGTPASAPGTPPAAHGPVKVPADLAAIKLSLLPNWDRDIDEAGTFQYVVRVKGTQSTKTFSFHYGYDDPRAPNDRDQYKKYLQDAKLLMGEIKDRQRGAAWFLEGTDASGLPAFRYLVLYGGKHLICYGSLYKDADGSRLGDDRDQTVIQAKQICETLAL